jgi:cobalt-zinc-cadmium efflux system outer membrane protein
MTLADLEQIALESNPTLSQSRMAIRSSQGRYLQAGLYPNPGVVYIADEIGNDGSTGLQGAGVVQPFVTGGKLRLDRAAASHAVAQARHGWDIQLRRVMNDVRSGYYEVLMAQKMIEVNQRLVGFGEKGAAVIQQLYEAEEVSRYDVLQARIEADQARLNLNAAENRHQAAWRRLVAIVGRPQMAPARLAGEVEEDLPQFRYEEVLADLLARSPELAHARSGVQKARCELARQCAEPIPDIEVGTAVKYDDATRFTVVDLEVGLRLPLFNRNQGNIVAARAALIAAEREVQRVKLDLQVRLTAAFEQYATARWQVETYQGLLLPNARKSLDMVQAGYLGGEFPYLTFLTGQRTYFRVNLDYLARLSELWTQSVELEGLLLTGGLDPVE